MLLVSHTVCMQRRRETTRVQVAERPVALTFAAIVAAVVALTVVVLAVVPR